LHAPLALFRSTSIRSLGDGRYVAKGTLSIRNRERDIELQFVRSETTAEKMLIDGSLLIHRTEFGIGGGEWNEGGVVAEEIPVKVHLALVSAGTKGRVAAAR
jgi:polyisoprenoid-binding protein YceI